MEVMFPITSVHGESCSLIVVYYCTGIPSPVRVRAEVTADNTSIRVSWEWQSQNVSICVDLITVHYRPEGGSLMNHTVGNSTATTSAILPNLQCDTKYTIWVEARGGQISRWSQHSAMVYLPAKGITGKSCVGLVQLMRRPK